MDYIEIKEKYLKFFEKKGHKVIPSASLIPENDPTVLFTTAGMQPLVPYLMGEKHPEGNKVTNVQKCIRTGDIDEVGDNTHLTFFEMLGNWSFQDYFKEEAIDWSFEFLIKELDIPLEKLAVSVFAGDDNSPFDEVAYGQWVKNGMPEERIAKLGKKENWWGPAGKTGPCGPDTEMFYWTGDGDAPKNFQETNEDERWVEIWNDVFMQYNKKDDGTYELLEKPSVDTGMGVERALAVLNGKKSVYETELFVPIIQVIEKVSGVDYGKDEAIDRKMRIIADHVRSAVMMADDGVLPSNKEQGYVMRRLIRRSSYLLNDVAGSDSDVESWKLDLGDVFAVSLNVLSLGYPDINKDEIGKVIVAEENKFRKTLSKGLKELDKIFEKNRKITGDDAFVLYSTYGFPYELTKEIAHGHGQKVDDKVFEDEFKKHQELSRAGAEKKFAGGLADDSDKTKALHSATHLMLQALRNVLGDHVNQKGSNITSERLRFDFSHPEKMTPEQKEEVVSQVNEAIKNDLPICFEMMTIDEARKLGATGVFDDKYSELGDKVKVYFVGDKATGEFFSKEVCGGPHAERTGGLGKFRIKKEESVSAGTRRIKAFLD
jgi:alanyl-tRNA synthetase